jgi:HK97 family phage major capsid protein
MHFGSSGRAEKPIRSLQSQDAAERSRTNAESTVGLLFYLPQNNRNEEIIMSDIVTKVEEAERVLTEYKEKSGYNEIIRQRKTVPGLGGFKSRENRSIELGDLDKKFLAYVRGQAGPAEMKALVEDDTGRYLVSPQIQAEIERSVAAEVVVRQLADKRTTTKDRITVRDMDEVSVAYGKLETGSLVTESSPTPGIPATKYIEDMNGLAKIGIDELEDSDNDLAAYVADSFARAISEVENLKFLKGAGHASGEPEGICIDTTLLANALTTAAVSVVTVEDFMQMIYAVPSSLRKGSSFIVNSLTELELRKLRSGGSTPTDGPFLWQPAVALGAPNTFLGYPIYSQDEMDDLSDTEGVIAIFGNFGRGYRVWDCKGISIQRLNELYAEAGLVGFLLRARNTGYPIKPSNKALVLLKEHSA